MIVILPVIAIFLWAMYCMRRAHKTRMSLIDKMGNTNNYWTLRAAFSEVSLASHTFALMTFRDPNKLYVKALQDLMK